MMFVAALRFSELVRTWYADQEDGTYQTFSVTLAPGLTDGLSILEMRILRLDQDDHIRPRVVSATELTGLLGSMQKSEIDLVDIQIRLRSFVLLERLDGDVDVYFEWIAKVGEIPLENVSEEAENVANVEDDDQDGELDKRAELETTPIEPRESVKVGLVVQPEALVDERAHFYFKLQEKHTAKVVSNFTNTTKRNESPMRVVW